jgi:hypothetical protein
MSSQLLKQHEEAFLPGRPAAADGHGYDSTGFPGSGIYAVVRCVEIEAGQ